MPPSSLLGSAVYVRYWDHVLFKNVKEPEAEPVKRETIGWFSQETEEIMLIEHDRTVPELRLSSGQCNGVVIMKNCIIEIRELPLQGMETSHLNWAKKIAKDECALHPKKRKTLHQQKGTGAK
jgi:hypothetical protein